LSRVSWKLSRTVLRGAVGGNADRLLDQRPDPKTKLPWMFAMKDDEIFALAGARRHWYSPDGKSQMDSFAVITTEPNELLVEKTGHDRMPVIIKRQDYQRWLEPGDGFLKSKPVSHSVEFRV
jgi:putative SOS response-associated peptidase YedK